jgi:hypothetical protein
MVFNRTKSVGGRCQFFRLKVQNLRPENLAVFESTLPREFYSGERSDSVINKPRVAQLHQARTDGGDMAPLQSRFLVDDQHVSKCMELLRYVKTHCNEAEFLPPPQVVESAGSHQNEAESFP